jgi:hypothetical protein
MGGAAGHMRHPFDLLSVRSGSDLIKIFEDLRSLINTSDVNIPNVKFDGINTSFKVLDDGRLGVDRGAYADVPGITIDNVNQRFEDAAGRRRTGT